MSSAYTDTLPEDLQKAIQSYLKRNNVTFEEALVSIFTQREKTRERNKRNANAYYHRNKETINTKRKERRDATKDNESEDDTIDTTKTVDMSLPMDDVIKQVKNI
jgi:hypothetical protein